MEKGYAIVNYHTGETLESRDINALKKELGKLASQENSSGFYYVLMVDVCQLETTGEDYYFTINPIEKHEVKHASDIFAILLGWE